VLLDAHLISPSFGISNSLARCRLREPYHPLLSDN
jgi:hypothetical protein